MCHYSGVDERVHIYSLTYGQSIMICKKITLEFDRKRSCLKRIRGYDTGEEGGGSRHSFANDKNNVIKHDKNVIKTMIKTMYWWKQCYCQLFMKYFFVLKLSRLNGYLKGYLKSRINKLPKKKNINFLLANTGLSKISVFYYLFWKAYLQKPIVQWLKLYQVIKCSCI